MFCWAKEVDGLFGVRTVRWARGNGEFAMRARPIDRLAGECVD